VRFLLVGRVAAHRCHSGIAILRTEPGGKCGVGQLVMTRPWPSWPGPTRRWVAPRRVGRLCDERQRSLLRSRRHVEFAGTTSNLLRATGDQRAEGPLRCRSAHHMSDEFDGLDAIEKAGIGATLNRCRALASKIGNELRNKRPEHFVDKVSLADVHASLERAADVLSTVKGSQARGTSGRQAAGARLGRRARRPSRRGRHSA
jgi:hypothetical protein